MSMVNGRRDMYGHQVVVSNQKPALKYLTVGLRMKISSDGNRNLILGKLFSCAAFPEPLTPENEGVLLDVISPVC